MADVEKPKKFCGEILRWEIGRVPVDGHGVVIWSLAYGGLMEENTEHRGLDCIDEGRSASP
jgi:hypothetical protein